MSLNNQECDLEFIIRIKRSADPVAKEDLVGSTSRWSSIL